MSKAVKAWARKARQELLEELGRAEAAAGLLQVLCGYHNRLKGDPQGNPHWWDKWWMDLHAHSYGERMEA